MLVEREQVKFGRRRPVRTPDWHRFIATGRYRAAQPVPGRPVSWMIILRGSSGPTTTKVAAEQAAGGRVRQSDALPRCRKKTRRTKLVLRGIQTGHFSLYNMWLAYQQ